MNTICFTLPTIEEVLFSVIPEQEEDSPEDILNSIGEKDLMIRGGFLKGVADNLEHSAFGWCTIKVVASWNGFEGCDYLGACSYPSLEAFFEGGYYLQMREAAFKELIDKLEKLSD